MKAQLIPLDGGRPHDIRQDIVLVGRKSFCDLKLRHRTVSKIHCVLVRTDGLLLLRDLGSRNGVRVNGRRVARAHLLPNDVLAIAEFHFRVMLGPDDQPAEGHERTHAMAERDDEVDSEADSEESASGGGPATRERH